MTLPTFTPAIRTSESGRSPLALENTACTVKWMLEGQRELVESEVGEDDDHDDPDQPRLEEAHSLSASCASASHGLSGTGASWEPVVGVAAEGLAGGDARAAVEGRALVAGRVRVGGEVAVLAGRSS